MRNVPRAMAGVMVAAVLTVGAAAQVTATDEPNDGLAEADAGSLGVTPDVTMCLVDAGSLGLPDPVTACNG